MPWFPTAFRDAITEVLSAMCTHLRIPALVRPVLRQLIEQSGHTQLIDLCSGAGGSVVLIQQELEAAGQPISVVLTDKFPNRPAFARAELVSGGRIRGLDVPVHATQVPPNLEGIRTLFNSLHHFSESEARAILADASVNNQPIAIFEITERTLLRTIANFVLSFAILLVLVPRLHSRRASWWLFTYLIPVLPLAFAWDASVSCLRSYTEEELQALTLGLSSAFRWAVGRSAVTGMPISVTYLTGLPDPVTYGVR